MTDRDYFPQAREVVVPFTRPAADAPTLVQVVASIVYAGRVAA